MPELSCTHLPAPVPAHGNNGGKQLKKVVFDVTPKMSTYLLAWAVGEFDIVQGVTKGGVMIRVMAPPGRGPQGQFALDVGIRSLDFYDAFFKVWLCMVCKYRIDGWKRKSFVLTSVCYVNYSVIYM